MQILLLSLQPVPPKLSHESVPTDEIQRQMNADALQAVFDRILAPLQEIANDCAVMDCADGKNALMFSNLIRLDCRPRQAYHIKRNKQ